MSYYRNNYKKQPKKNKHSKNLKSAGMTALSILLIFTAISGIAALFRNGSKAEENVIEYKTVYLVPSEAWKSDDSSIGVWCWSNTSIPSASFVLATDENKDGIYEVNINKEYTGLAFVDLKPGETELGVDWANKREQTNNLVVPCDNKVYYHQYANEWSVNSDILFEVTTEVKNVKLNCATWTCTVQPVVYCFDKTGVKEPEFISMTQCGNTQYIGDVPAGFTHIIFIEYSDETSIGTWDNILNQTADLIIPVGDVDYFNIETNEWYMPVDE